jgi:hypothetical protein
MSIPPAFNGLLNGRSFFFKFIQQIWCHFFLRIDGLTARRLRRSDGKNPTAILCRFAAK